MTLDLLDSEAVQWRRAADAMYLPVDARHRVHPQDDCFLDRPRLEFRDGPATIGRCYCDFIH
jgi:trehalose/maltose hydrolase-like predicted phosphorylase